MEMNNIEFIGIISQIDTYLRSLVARMRLRFPEKRFGKIDLSFYSADRTNYPKFPVGLNWEICIDEEDRDGDEYFTFELGNEDDLWCLDGYVSKHQDLELVEDFVEFETETLIQMSRNVEAALKKFENKCLKYLAKQ